MIVYCCQKMKIAKWQKQIGYFFSFSKKKCKGELIEGALRERENYSADKLRHKGDVNGAAH